MNEEERALREKAIKDYLDERILEVLEKLENLYQKYDKKINELL